MSTLNAWDIVDANNDDAPPDGWPENTMDYSDVNDAGRAVQGTLKRYFADVNGSLVAGGIADAYTVTLNETGYLAYFTGMYFACKINAANTGASTMNVNGIGVRNIVGRTGNALDGGEITSGLIYEFRDDGTELQLMSTPDLSASSGASDVGYLPAGVGAVATTVQKKLRESGNALDHATGDGVTDDNAALQVLLNLGKNVDFPSGGGTFISSGNLTMSANQSINLNGCTLKFTLTGAVEALSMRDNTEIYNGTIEVAGSSPSGAGNFQCPIVVGDFADGDGYENISIHDLEIKSNRSDGNGMFITGNSNNIDIYNITYPASTTMGRNILIHWGNVNGAVGGTQTDHPHNITLDNIEVIDQTGMPTNDGAVIFISGAYDVKVSNIDGHNITTGVICYAGDYGDQYAVAAQSNRVGRGITVENVTLTDLSHRAIKVAGLPTISGSALEFPVEFRNFHGFADSAGSDNGAILTDCVGTVFDHCRLSGFTFSGINVGEAAHNGKIIGGQYDNNGFNGIRIRDTTTNPEGWVIDDPYVHSNNTNDNAGATDKGGVSLTACKNIKVLNGRFGATSETQFYSIRTDSTAVDIHLDGNNTDFLKAAGIAYSMGSTTNYAINVHGSNNIAASGLTLHEGVPIYTINSSSGNKEFFAAAAPASGTWGVGDKVWNTSPAVGTATDMGFVCTTAGTPGTWKGFGDIAA